MSSGNLVRIALVKEVTYGQTPAATAASKVVQDLTYTAKEKGTGGNLISIAYTTGGTAGSEVVTVSGKAISVQIQSGTSTASQVRTAVLASTPAMALLDTVVISGTGSNAQTSASAVFLLGGAGDLSTARFVSEKLSGTPDTVESKQIRTDRMSSGQIVAGLSVGGDISLELAKESVVDDLFSSLLQNSWDQKSIITVDLTIDVNAKTISRASGDWAADGIVVGDFALLSGFATSGNNVHVMVAEIVDADTIRYVGPSGMADETGSGTGFKRLDKLSIGTAQKSFSMEKKFLDLTNKAILYKGMLVSQMELNVNYGDLITGSATFSGNGHDPVDAAADMLSYHRTVAAPATSQSLNGSVDMPFLASSAIGTLDSSGLDIQSVSLSMNNNDQALNAIGTVPPLGYASGTLQIQVSLNAYLKDAGWDMVGNKLSQTPFSLGYMVQNSGGGYGFFLPAVQVSFDDPASSGQNTIISLETSGQAKVGSNGESAITIYRTA